jgi:hypothetical protein
VITQIVAGKREEVRLVEKGGKERTMPRKEFAERCVLTPENKVPQEFANVAYAVLESDTCPLCKAGLQLVDTLPFHASPEHAAVTRAYLNQVDAVLLVISDNQLFDNVDLDFIDSVRREGDSGLGHVFFFINDHGLDASGKEAVFRIARYYLEPEFGEAFERHVFLADAKSALEGRVNGQKDVVDATTLLAFEQEIDRFLKGSERVNVILDATVRDVLIPVIAAARSRLKMQKEKLAQWEESIKAAARNFVRSRLKTPMKLPVQSEKEVPDQSQSVLPFLPSRAEVIWLETVNAFLTEAFDEICESAYGRVLTPQEQQELFDKEDKHE